MHHTVIYGEIVIGNSWFFPKDKNYCFNIRCLGPFDLALQDRVVSEKYLSANMILYKKYY